MTTIEDQARAIFLAALERGSDQWPAFLDEACGGDAELRTRVDQHLYAHQAMGSIHGGGAGLPVTATDEPLREGPGTVIGPYKLLEQIGEGHGKRVSVHLPISAPSADLKARRQPPCGTRPLAKAHSVCHMN